MNNQFKLLCQLSHANSLQEMTDVGYELLGNPICIQDMTHSTLAYTKCVAIENKYWPAAVCSDSERIIHLQDREGEGAGISEKGRLPAVIENGDIPYPRVIKVLVRKGKPLGVMVLIAFLQPLGPDDVQLMELLSTIVIQQFPKEQFVLPSNKRPVEDFITKLLDGGEVSQAEAAKKLEIINLKLLPHLCVMAFWRRKDSAIEEGESLDAILQAMSSMPYCRALIYNGSLVLLHSSDHPINDWEEELPQFISDLYRWKLIGGISHQFLGLENVRKHYFQARAALQIASKLERPNCLFPYDSVSIYHLFQTLPPDADLRFFCNQKILKLEKIDILHNANLMLTLRVYLDHSKSLAKTAEVLCIHRNTVRYRVKKCMEILGSDLESGIENFSFVLSLRIMEYEERLAEPTLPSLPD
jgi:PucR family transcriptional regulator, proline-responsive transcriptional activator